MLEDSNHKDAFKKYLNGELSDSDQHELEKKALEDPFLADALEGAGGFRDVFEEDLKALESRRKRPQPQIWLRVAASILLIASTGITFWLLNTGQTEPSGSLALKEEVAELPEPDEQQELAPVVAQEELEEEMISAQEDESPPTAPAPARQKTTPSSQREPQIQAGETPPQMGAIVAEVDEDALAEPPAQLEYANSMEQPTMALDRRAQASDAEPDAQAKMDVSVLEEAVSESIVFEEKASRKTALSNTNENNPVIGWEAYHTYLTDSLRYPEQAKKLNIEGSVFVKVETNKKGEPKKLEVLKSLGYGCDEEALRLIKEGPNFEKKGEVIVPVKFSLQ